MMTTRHLACTVAAPSVVLLMVLPAAYALRDALENGATANEVVSSGLHCTCLLRQHKQQTHANSHGICNAH
jgi:hypothetical protein